MCIMLKRSRLVGEKGFAESETGKQIYNLPINCGCAWDIGTEIVV